MNPSGCCPSPAVFSLFQGDAIQMNLKLAYDTGDPVDLTSCTAITVALPLSVGGVTALTLAASQVAIATPANLGKFYVTAAAIGAISAGLNVGCNQNFDVTFVIAGNQTTTRYYGALTVNETE